MYRYIFASLHFSAVTLESHFSMKGLPDADWEDRIVQISQPIVVRTGEADVHLEYPIMLYSAAAWRSRRTSLMASRRASSGRVLQEQSESATRGIISVQRRFRDFFLLRKELRPIAAAVFISLPKLPRRTLRHNLSSSFGARRQLALQEWLRTVVACQALWSDALCRFFGLPLSPGVRSRQISPAGPLYLSPYALHSMFNEVAVAWRLAVVDESHEEALPPAPSSPLECAVERSPPAAARAPSPLSSFLSCGAASPSVFSSLALFAASSSVSSTDSHGTQV